MTERVLEAELTWTGERFESGVRLAIGADGRFARVGPDAGEPSERLPGRALLPGFTSAHSHAFQRALRGHGETYPAGRGSFWTWREAMYALVLELDVDRFHAASLACFREMRAAGITSVGEFHYLHHDASGAGYALDEALLAAAREAGIRLVLLETCYRRGGFDRPLAPAQRRFGARSTDELLAQVDRLTELADPALQSVGLAVHSVRAVPPDDVEALGAEAERRGLVLHAHVEEQRREVAECLAAHGKTPMALLCERLPISARTTAVHCTHTAPADLERFVAAGGRVCVCPTTEASLADGVPDLPRMRALGASISLGTDSNARVSMLEEARWLEYAQRLAREERGVMAAPDGELARELLRCATVEGARALGLDAGTVEPGAPADLALVDLGHPSLAGWTEDTLLAALLLGAADGAIAGSLVGGR